MYSYLQLHIEKTPIMSQASVGSYRRDNEQSMGSQGLYLKPRSMKQFELKFRCIDSIVQATISTYHGYSIEVQYSLSGLLPDRMLKTVITRLLRYMNTSIMGKLFIQTLDSPRIRIMMDSEYQFLQLVSYSLYQVVQW